MTMTDGHDRWNDMTKRLFFLMLRLSFYLKNRLPQNHDLPIIKNRKAALLRSQKMILNMVATWKKGLFVLGLTTVVLAAPVMGIEVRHFLASMRLAPAPHNRHLSPLLDLSHLTSYSSFLSERG